MGRNLGVVFVIHLIAASQAETTLASKQDVSNFMPAQDPSADREEADGREEF